MKSFGRYLGNQISDIFCKKSDLEMSKECQKTVFQGNFWREASYEMVWKKFWGEWVSEVGGGTPKTKLNGKRQWRRPGLCRVGIVGILQSLSLDTYWRRHLTLSRPILFHIAWNMYVYCSTSQYQFITKFHKYFVKT